MNEPVRVRRATIDGLPAFAVDGFMSREDAERIFLWLVNQPFTRNEFARPETKAFLHWVYKMDVKDCMGMSLYPATLKAVEACLPGAGPQRCYRSYCNLAAYGDMLFTHTDSRPGMDGWLTALWYIAPRWDTEWGGETILFNSQGDAEFVVSPRPGRLLLFDGLIRHAGRPPNRVCVIPRLTFALKLAPANAAGVPPAR